MLEQISDKLAEYGILREDILFWAFVILGVAIVLRVVQKLITSPRRPKIVEDEETPIRLEEFTPVDPPESGKIIELYNIPVRPIAVVAAPCGRQYKLPGSNRAICDLLDIEIPGLGDLIEGQGAVIIRWPTQLSASGFAHKLFRNIDLPEQGRRSQWSIVAGLMTVDEINMAIGIVFWAAAPNGYGQETISTESDWRRLLSVRKT